MNCRNCSYNTEDGCINHNCISRKDENFCSHFEIKCPIIQVTKKIKDKITEEFIEQKKRFKSEKDKF